jgi:hypothetical protein
VRSSKFLEILALKASAVRGDVGDGDYVQAALTYESYAKHVTMKGRRRDAVIEGQTSSTCCQNEKNLKMSTAWCLRHSLAPYLMTLASPGRNAKVEVEVDEDKRSVLKVWAMQYAELSGWMHVQHGAELHLQLD